jgi:hypothetical protein
VQKHSAKRPASSSRGQADDRRHSIHAGLRPRNRALRPHDRRSLGVGFWYAFGPRGRNAPRCGDQTVETRGSRIDGEGQAVLTVRLPTQDLVRKLSMKRELQAIEKEIAEQRFFDLPATLGRTVADGSTRRLTVKTAQQTKTVTNLHISDAAMNSDARRALWLFDRIRGTFESRKPLTRVHTIARCWR